MHWFCLQYVKNKEDADEIVNDSFLAVWEKKESIEFGEHLKSYLYTIVKNKSINFLKKRKIELDFDDKAHEVSSNLSNPSQLLEIKELENKVQYLIENLPLKCRQVFVLSRKEQLSNKEIASILDISPKTVENQITIAIKSIKSKLDEQPKINKNGLNMTAIVLLALSQIY